MPPNLALGSLKSTGSSTTRSLGDRFGDTKNVKDYGALGTGSGDDTATCQAAINAAIDAGGGTVYFPTGNYPITNLTFTHGVGVSGSKLVRLVGEASNDNFWGSRLIGTNNNGFIVDQNDFQVLTISGQVGTFTIGEVVTGGTSGAVAPLVSQSAGVLNFHGTGFGTYQAGEIVTGNSSGAHATVVTVTLNPLCLKEVRNLYISNGSATAGTGALRLEGTSPFLIDGCYINGMLGIVSASNVFNGHIRGCNISGPSRAAGSVGVNMTQVHISDCNFLAWETALRHSNTGGAIINCRFETNNTAVKTGIDETGANSPSSGLLISGCQTERNDTGIYFFNISASAIIGNIVTGLVKADGSAQELYGYRFAQVTGCFVGGCSYSGKASVAAWSLEGANLLDLSFSGCSTVNTGSGSAWVIPNVGAGANRIDFTCCDNPSFAKAFADLPTQVVEGQRDFITNCSTTTFLAAADGAGANHVPVVYQASGGWRVG